MTQEILARETEEMASEQEVAVQTRRNLAMRKMRQLENGAGQTFLGASPGGSQLATGRASRQLGGSPGGRIGRGGQTVQGAIKNVIAELEAAKCDESSRNNLRRLQN